MFFINIFNKIKSNPIQKGQYELQKSKEEFA